MSDQHDKEMEAFVDPLKQIDIPDTLRSSNRLAIARTLKQETTQHHLHWWQRRLSVPLPVAAAILLVIVLQWVFQLHSLTQTQRQSVPTVKDGTQNHEFVAEEETFGNQYQQKSVYVAGLGTIHQAEFYHF